MKITEAMYYMNHYKHFILSVLLCIFSSGNFIKSQNPATTDSFKTAIYAADEDTVKVRLLIELGNNYKNNKPDSALQNFQLAFELAKSTKSNFYIAKSSNALGVYYYSQSNYKPALEYYNQALVHYEEITNSQGISDSYNNIAIIYAIQGDYEKSLEYFLKAAKINDESGNKKENSRLLNNIGLIYNNLGDNEKAITYFQKSLAIHLEDGNKQGIAACYNNLGLVYYSQKSYNKALEIYNKGLDITNVDDKKGQSIFIVNIGSVYMEQKMFDKASSYFLRALTLYTEIGDKHGISKIYGDLYQINIYKKNYTKAIENALKELEISIEIGALPIQQAAYQNLSIAYDSLHNYKNALKYHQMHQLINDSIFNEKKSKQLSEMQTKFESLEKEKENELLRKDNELKRLKIDDATNIRNFFIVLSVLILLLVIIIFYRLKAKKEANLLLEEKNEVIEKQKEQLSISLNKLKELNEDLNSHKFQLEEKVVQRTAELEIKNAELERFNGLFVGREFRIKELRDEIKALKEQINKNDVDIDLMD